MFKKLFKFQRDRDEKLVDRLQKKLTDPTSPSNSPMVKKLKVKYFFLFLKIYYWTHLQRSFTLDKKV